MLARIGARPVRAFSRRIASKGTKRLKACVNYDSVASVTREGHRIEDKRERLTQAAALGLLLVVGALAIAGPSGLLAWSENLRLLDQRRAQIAALETDRMELKQLVDGLNPDRADPDLVGELIRRNLNVVHPDEVVITLEPRKP